MQKAKAAVRELVSTWNCPTKHENDLKWLHKMESLQTDKPRILVADDDPGVLDLYGQVLTESEDNDPEISLEMDALRGKLFKAHEKDATESSFELVTCNQGNEAVDAVADSLERREPFSVAFLDVRMPPGPDGVWAAEKIRALDPDIELVMVTGYSDVHPEGIANRVRPPHKLLYVQKPFHPQEISHFAKTLYSKWLAERELRQIRSSLEETVAERTAQLEKANQSMSEFLTRMSHEIRTPLNHVIGFTELVVDNPNGELNEQHRGFLNDALDSGRHLLHFINDILDFSRVKAGKLQLELSEIDLHLLLNTSFNIIKEKVINQDIKLDISIDCIPETVWLDEQKIEQILYNLLSNAAKFTPNGDQIQLSARTIKGIFHSGQRQTDSKEIRKFEQVPEKNNGDEGLIENCIEFSVADNGIGIKKEDRNRIFHAFEQVDGSNSSSCQGTGLGLTLAKSLVELHGGKIWVESEGENRGSIFKFIIPIYEDRVCFTH